METITPTEERVRLRVDLRRTSRKTRLRRLRECRDVMTRWLERAAHRKGRHINEPSVTLSYDRDPSVRQTYLYAVADSFPETLPDWLRTAVPVVEGAIKVLNLREVALSGWTFEEQGR